MPWHLVNVENNIHRDMYVKHRSRVLDVSSTPLRLLFKSISRPTSAFFRYRLQHKLYRNAPELALMRCLRRKLFYESESTMS
ncbi:hypothetical protein [Humidesulfovibrio idahonensis]